MQNLQRVTAAQISDLLKVNMEQSWEERRAINNFNLRLFLTKSIG